jgi:hypothetical protein
MAPAKTIELLALKCPKITLVVVQPGIIDFDSIRASDTITDLLAMEIWTLDSWLKFTNSSNNTDVQATKLPARFSAWATLPKDMFVS